MNNILYISTPSSFCRFPSENLLLCTKLPGKAPHLFILLAVPPKVKHIAQVLTCTAKSLHNRLALFFRGVNSPRLYAHISSFFLIFERLKHFSRCKYTEIL